MEFDEEFRTIMQVMDDLYPSSSGLDVALAKIGAYMANLASSHEELISKYQVAVEEFFEGDRYIGMTPEQMRCFFRACPNLRDPKLRPYLDDLWNYFIKNDAFDAETMGNIEQARGKKGDRWLSKGLLNKHLSRMVDPVKDGIFVKSVIDGKSRYIIKFKGDMLNLRIPFEIKKAVAETPVSNIQSDSNGSIKAFLFNCSLSNSNINGPLKEKQFNFNNEMSKMSVRFGQEVIDLYLRTFFPGRTETEVLKELQDLKSHSPYPNEVEKKQEEIEKRKGHLLSPLPIILIAPLGEVQLQSYLPHDD